MIKNCGNCKRRNEVNDLTCELCLHGLEDNWEWGELISFQRLNGLTPTVESCTMKLIEELGELLQLIGKGKQASGESNQGLDAGPERLISEAFDVAQSAVTMINTIAGEFGIDVVQQQEMHERKLREKGYLK